MLIREGEMGLLSVIDTGIDETLQDHVFVSKYWLLIVVLEAIFLIKLFPHY